MFSWFDSVGSSGRVHIVSGLLRLAFISQHSTPGLTSYISRRNTIRDFNAVIRMCFVFTLLNLSWPYALVHGLLPVSSSSYYQMQTHCCGDRITCAAAVVLLEVYPRPYCVSCKCGCFIPFSSFQELTYLFIYLLKFIPRPSHI